MKKEINKKDIYILGIETSCDETSMSIVKNGRQEIKSVVLTQIPVHKQFGGVVPEIASRCHIENITIVIEELFSDVNITIDDIDYIAVTYGPGLIGSLIIGVEAAKSISFITGKPLIKVHHIRGHIYANNLVKELEFPLIALVVSGGHSDLILMKKHYEFEKLGGSLDDAIGEAYDKIARILNLSYPGGPEIDKRAPLGFDTYSLPLPLDDDSYNFSFSGIKSAVLNLVNNEKMRGNEIRINDLCASFQNRVIEILTKKTINALKKYKVNNLIIAGGVAANIGLRKSFEKLSKEENFNLIIPEFKYCTDNAAMIASAGYYGILKDKTDLSLKPVSVDNYYE
ncbi:MAG: tRNA (adenosine(37)-N6)-threonylcarbamoyltransferase complex transferase subunit TsaD [Bacilli bacterium]